MKRSVVVRWSLIALAVLLVATVGLWLTGWRPNFDRSIVSAQQVADLKFKPPIPRPAYEAGDGPRVAIDEAHHNFHTARQRCSARNWQVESQWA